jgi:HK97 gp10 family phage protein
VPADASQIRALSRDIRTARANAPKIARRATQKACADTKRDYQSGVRVDTGNLRSSASYETHELRGGVWGEVGPTADYGLFEELGTSRMPGNGALGRAFDRNVEAYERALEQMGQLP